MSYHRRYIRKKNRRKRQIKTIIIIGVFIIALALGVVSVFLFSNSNSIEKETATTDTAIPTTTKMVATMTTKSNTINNTLSKETKANKSNKKTSTTEAENNIQKKRRNKVLSDIGIEAKDYEFNQLVVVKADGSKAKIYFFEKNKEIWDYSKKLKTVDGYVGTQGVSSKASEYAQYTPSGLFALSTAFGIRDNPGTKMDYFNVTSNSYWVDDPNSAYYNQHVEGTKNADWKSAEHLIESSPAYNYAVFIEYNTNPIVPGKGSAFFVHVGYEPTAGCVSMPEDSMISLLKWLNPKKYPHILIM